MDVRRAGLLLVLLMAAPLAAQQRSHSRLFPPEDLGILESPDRTEWQQPDRVMDFIIHNEVVPAVNQIETHPFNQHIDTQKFLQENGVQIESWGPFAEGKNNIFQNELLLSLAGKYKKSVAQIILRWMTQRGVVAIPKSVRKERIAENFAVFDFELRPEDMAAIAALDTGRSMFLDHRDPKMVRFLSEARRNT